MKDIEVQLRQELEDRAVLEGLPSAHELPSSFERQMNSPLISGLSLLWSHRTDVFKITAWITVSAIIAVVLLPNKYDSTTRLMPPDQRGSTSAMLSALGGKADSMGVLASDLMGAKNTGEEFLGILRSRSLEDRIINRLDLRRVYWEKRYVDTRKDLERNTVIEQDRKSGIISITVRDKSPQRAAAIANAYVEELNKSVAELSTSAARRERIFLEGRLKVVKDELDSTSKSFSQFASSKVALDIPQQGKSMVEAAAVLEGQLIAARAELTGIQEIYTSNNSRVRELRAHVAELETQLSKLEGNSAVSGNDDLPSLRQIPVLGVTYADFYRREKIDEVVYETLTKQYELARVEEAKEIPSIKVLDPADIPERKASPHRLILVVVSFVLGLMFSASWIIGKSRFETLPIDHPYRLITSQIKQSLVSTAARFRRKRLHFARK